MFPFGTQSWNIETISLSGKKVTAMNYYASRLMIRGDNHYLHLFCNLFQQFIVDMYAKIEQQRLQFLRFNQKLLRSHLLSGLQDAVRLEDGSTDLSVVGRRIILPSSFVGSARYMQQLYQDAISIVRRFGKPDFFITFTCNPKWPEIRRELLHSKQTVADRPDLYARVFKQKLSVFMEDLISNQILGKVIAHIHVIEFQKRGLPHAHILLIVSAADKPRTVEDIDKIVSAKIPDPVNQRLAYETVTSSMMHGPCGDLFPNAPCMKDGKCSKSFPHKFNQSTTIEEGSGFPKYHRPQNGRVIYRNGIPLGNAWVVPHNIDRCIKYNAHINVEICNTVKSVKYIYKYVYKGHDRASVEMRTARQEGQTENAAAVQVEGDDEIQQFLDARYVSSSEACWRIFHFSLHQEYPSHQRLQIHLEGQQNVCFYEASNRLLVDIVENAEAKDTTLTAWFKYNRINESARQYLYGEFPEHFFVWRNNVWHPRKNPNGSTIGRIYAVSPKTQEKYYLRMLLQHVRGALSYQDLRTVNQHVYPTF